jgi:hypothetical protein
LRLTRARVLRRRLGHDEFVQFVALDHVEEPTTSARSRSLCARPLIAGIGEDAVMKGRADASSTSRGEDAGDDSGNVVEVRSEASEL